MVPAEGCVTVGWSDLIKWVDYAAPAHFWWHYMKPGNIILGLVVAATLVVQIGLLNATVTSLTSEKKASAERAQQTIEIQGKTINDVWQQYESLVGLMQSVLVPYCNGSSDVLSEARLGLDLFTTALANVLHQRVYSS